MKIGIILISDNFAGAENVVYILTKQLKKNGFDIDIILNEEILKYFSNLSYQGIKIHNLGKISFDNPFSLQKSLYHAQKKFNFILNENKYDLINTHMIVPIRIYKRVIKNNLPLVITTHGSEILRFINPPFFYKHFIKKRMKRILTNCSRIISVSSWQIQNLPEKYKKKTIVISNGVDSKVFKPLKNIKQKKNVILFAGRFIDIKGIREIINVAKQLPQYEFWFAGQGPLANLINLPNTKNLGFKTTEELVKLYNQATICIAPSHRESFGLVGLEAMSCGKAVIATPLGFSEYIESGKDGIIIPSKDEKALKENIIKIMTDEKFRKKLEKNARKKALKYSWDKVARQYLKVFKEVIKNEKKKK